jgi:hypothetical protein
MTKNPKYKRYRIHFCDIGKIFYDENLAYIVKMKKFGTIKRFVWVRCPNLDFIRGKNFEYER